MRLFHVSEEPDIECFEPRDPPSGAVGVTDKVVWAVEGCHLVNYLLPRDCPHVTFYPVPSSQEVDVAQLLGPSRSRHVVAIEAVWFKRVINCHLWIYELPVVQFVPVDLGAGYFVSRHPVTPIAKEEVESPVAAILQREAELRVLPSLWSLRDAVIKSSLQFSCIRMRNAAPRPTESQTP